MVLSQILLLRFSVGVVSVLSLYCLKIADSYVFPPIEFNNYDRNERLTLILEIRDILYSHSLYF